MAEAEGFDRRFWLLPVIVVVVAALTVWLAHISFDKVAEEVFGALVEIFVGVCVVGAAISWYRERQSARLEKAAMMKELVAIDGDISRSRLFMRAHESAQTWKNEVRELAALNSRFWNLQESMRLLGEAGRAKYRAGFQHHMEEAKRHLDKLLAEYENEHERTAARQEEFEDLKEAGLAPDRALYWQGTLACLPEMRDLVGNDQDSGNLVRELHCASALLNRDLLGL